VLAFQRAKDEKRYVGRLVRDALTVGRGDVTSAISSRWHTFFGLR